MNIRDKFYFVLPIEIELEPGCPGISTPPDAAEPAEPNTFYGYVRDADDNEPELPDCIRAAVEKALATDAGAAWMASLMEAYTGVTE